MWKIPTNLWMISPSPRKSELYQNTLGVFPNFSVEFQSEQHSAMSSSRACRGYLTKLWQCHLSHQKDSTPSLYTDYTDSVHRMFLSTLILQRRQYSTLFIHRSTQTFLWARDLERGPCWKKMLSEVTPRNWYETWEVGRNAEWKKKVNVFTENLQKNYHSRLKTIFIHIYRYWNVYLDVIWVVVIHFVFVLTLGVIPFKVTVAIRKNHCKFDPISWICQKTIPGMLDLWGGRIVRKRWGSCWKSGVWVARTFVIFWGSGKKNGGIRAVVLYECPPNRNQRWEIFLKDAGKPAGYCPQNSHGTFHVVWQR